MINVVDITFTFGQAAGRLTIKVRESTQRQQLIARSSRSRTYT